MPADDLQFTRTSAPFSLTCAVRVTIFAGAQDIWDLLTNAPDYPRWNSTITRIEGDIREGQRLRLHVPGTPRTFMPRVGGVLAGRCMNWTGGFNPIFKGVRTFELHPLEPHLTTFRLQEHFSGVVFALVRRSLPDFQPIFETFASDLKREAERRASARTV